MTELSVHEGSRPRTVSETALARVAAIAVVALVLLGGLGVSAGPRLETFGLVFASITIEALPFVLIGAFVSAAVAVFVPGNAFLRIGRLPLRLQIPGVTLAGFAFPVCECGSVPVARRLMMRGVHPAAALSFMLAAPIINPIVLASTWVAYGGGQRGLEMVGARAGLGLAVAVLAGWLIGRRAQDALLRVGSEREDSQHAHGHGSWGDRLTAFFDHAASDFLFMGRYLVLGAALAALMQTTVPQTVIAPIADAPVLSALALMGLAFVLSLCSEADAFVAVSFTAFPLGSQLAFLVLGPMVDTKLAVMYGATFKRWFVLRLVIVIVPLILVGSLIFDGLTR
jgi:uncharacterized membrane protein YraQ (UPF0718 family)